MQRVRNFLCACVRSAITLASNWLLAYYRIYSERRCLGWKIAFFDHVYQRLWEFCTEIEIYKVRHDDWAVYRNINTFLEQKSTFYTTMFTVRYNYILCEVMNSHLSQLAILFQIFLIVSYHYCHKITDNHLYFGKALRFYLLICVSFDSNTLCHYIFEHKFSMSWIRIYLYKAKTIMLL